MEIIIMIGICSVFYSITKAIESFRAYNKDVKEAKKILKTKKELAIKQEQLLQKEQDIKLEEEKLNIMKKDIDYIAKENSQTSPWLAERYSDYFEIADNEIEKYLIHKKNPAIKASQIVSNIKKEKKELLKQNKLLQYSLSFLISEFPMLEDAMQLDAQDLKDAIDNITSNKELKNDYEILSPYLSPEEYQKLSNVEKYQLALDRYLNKKKKSLWEIGISYERYVGYIYEMQGYKVTYYGAIKGFEDLGRDIIAENNSEILIIQCKYWRKEKNIRENVVFQLYGTMILKQLETKKTVKGILVTTTTLSDEARKIAKYLNIYTRENETFDKSYPCIKCNINRITNEKIYHLPFDQQYDRIQIETKKGEKYVSTVKEAEELRLQKSIKA